VAGCLGGWMKAKRFQARSGAARPWAFGVLVCGVAAQGWALETAGGAEEKAPPARGAPPGVPLIVPLAPPESLPVVGADASTLEFVFFEPERRDREFDLMVRSQFEAHGTSGPGRGSSFLDSGEHWLNELDVNLRSNLGNGWQANVDSIVRHTNSRRHDPRDFSVQRLRLTFEDERHRISLGDYYASLSQFSLNRSIKGVAYQHSFGGEQYLRVTGGSFTPRWDHLHSRKSDRPIDSHVGGLRYQTAGDNYRVGLNFVAARDRSGDSVRTVEDTHRQWLPALDWSYRSHSGLQFSGEHAYASTRREQVDGSSMRLRGDAHRLAARGRLGRLGVRSRFERIDPDFLTMGGGAANDRMRYNLRTDYRLDQTWSVFAAYDWQRNNLDGDLAGTTRSQIPELGFTARGLFDRRNFTASSSLRRRMVESGGLIDRREHSDRIMMSLQDRFGEVSVRGEVEWLLNRQRSPQRDRFDDQLYRLVIDSRHLLAQGRFDLRPFLTLERQETEDPFSGETIRTHAARLDLRLLAPSDLAYGLSLEAGHTDNDVPGADNTKPRRANANLEYRPPVLRGGHLRLEAGYGDFSFSDKQRNYRERYFQMLVQLPFDNRN